MRQPKTFSAPRALPRSIAELCVHLESQKIETFSQGEALLADLLAAEHTHGEARAPLALGPTPVLLCAAEAPIVARALPRAVITGEGGRRLTQATADGPVDLLPTGQRDETSVAAMLPRFGLGALGFAYRPATDHWCDPEDQRAACRAGRLEPMSLAPDPFEVAPRRYWIAARLIAEYDLEPSAALLEAASKALPLVEDRLPEGAPARRALSRVLLAPRPGPALAFLRQVGVTHRLVPGAHGANDARMAALPERPALRWAAWLRGGSTVRSLVRLRMPHELARQIERFQAVHPLDRTLARRGEAGARRLLQRFDDDEVEALIEWRRIELAERADDEEAREAGRRLDAFVARVASLRETAARSGRVRELAFDGRAVMAALGIGPGPHIGRALAHLTEFVADRPESNEPSQLEAELLRWAAQTTLGSDRQIG